MTKDEALQKMVDRFLGWNLPYDFYPDCGINFERTYRGMQGEEPRVYLSTRWPVGTNILTANQAKEMIKHLLGDDIKIGD